MKFAWHTDTYVLVQEWTTATTLGLVLAMVTSCVLTVVHEYIRQVLTARAQDRQRSQRRRHRAVFLLCQTTLFMISVFISNILMLVLMTYNSWLFLSIVIGAGCGYFITKPLFPTPPPSPQAHQSISVILKPQSSHTTGEFTDPSSPSQYFALLPDTQSDNQRDTQQHKGDSLPNRSLLNKNKSENNHKNSIYDDDIGVLLDSSPFKRSQEISYGGAN